MKKLFFLLFVSLLVISSAWSGGIVLDDSPLQIGGGIIRSRFDDAGLYKYAFYFEPKKILMDQVSGQPMIVQDLLAGRPGYNGTVHGVGEAVVDSDGLLTYGAYTNLIFWSEDISNALWWTFGASKEAPNRFVGLEQGALVAQDITTIEGMLYTFSFVASIPPGAQTDNYRIAHYGSASASWTALPITTFPKPFSVTVLGKEGGGIVNFGIQDWNTSDWAEITVTDFQVTETPYALPYVRTEGSAVSVPENYSDADQGLKFQMVPDEVGSVYTGPVIGQELIVNGQFTDTTSVDTTVAPFTGWDNLSTHDANNKCTIENGACRLISDGTYTGIGAPPSVIGKCYELNIEIVEVISGQLAVLDGFLNTLGLLDSPGTYKFRYKATEEWGVHLKRYITDGPTNIVFDNVSLREVSRNMGMPKLFGALDGTYTNLMLWSEDISNAAWDGYEVNVAGPNKFTATGVTGGMSQDIETTEGALYTFSFAASVPVGAQTTGYYIMHYQSGTLSDPGYNITNLVLTNEPTRYSVTVLGRPGGGAISFGIEDDNEANWAEITVTDFQVTETPCIMPYVKTEDSEVSAGQTSGEMVIEWVPMFDYDDGITSATESIGIISSRNEEQNFVYLQRDSDWATKSTIRISDETGSATAVDFQWQKAVPYTLRIIYGPHPGYSNAQKMQVVVTDGTTTWDSGVEDFDESFDPEEFLSMAFGNGFPQYIKSIKIYKEPKSWLTN
ncbi:hypothetical protein [Desulfospira joergensenii]|uniref:hypothetical protein n=1 Tax=Desulfospira joergensenii TaxID=53329 RepID=UPI0003B73B3B|nr:hypothetical protein [Desulfospira joergensenii]